ncbi:MAG: hypothetical protein A2700_02320 [Candidatus Blackburnbacteria bacterium RIFCSPHIGHO2_01_FULL_44_64]|uniref:ATP-grasp domain-containing protein n=1 Tax=Candidatus Blackburnbacteria bacterium RIFCSPHIGHO2_02_FULL_44_20 TaxID=1797516 RepID=A0A1G1V522_9BACT|nr:MAG: hypothetical protein A2700_02320 [Candidatus Blackburnbacteria bacterium RIFCSPHIGHO2_01_FULL_44_64]OGY10451.1 MAG: hypothetical protein A3D26_04335 [Candidatus Blackburnbacteria bacterium RIFCSPHIGHO2_02_FULL_44_20]OGY10687.1 MAG: hypothetical protein A3E16_01745 [Candidatus Blackburnbacteria bacterium RIFCSPHIGHO2_12_FULL_44_25]OGY13381.1 MAG: hypothetical protein A3A62_01070 [Candidatus Blackburnbacteria bacterium RIFCSPLOWO2_01_FULL_44_43]
MKKILILAGGKIKHLEPFLEAGKNVGAEVVVGSFGELSYLTESSQKTPRLFVGERDIADFDVIYFRLVGKRAEDAALVVSFAREHKIPVVDQIYTRDGFINLPLKKGQEAVCLVQAGISFPKTFFGGLDMILEKAPEIFDFPFVVKGSYGKQGHAVWRVDNKDQLRKLVGELKKLEREGKRFFAQEFIKITERTRVFVLGDRLLGSITMPTKWRRYVQGIYGGRETPERSPLTERELALAVGAAQALGIDVAGVDLIQDLETRKVYVLEVNSAPRWARFKKETGINVEEEIVKYLAGLS